MGSNIFEQIERGDLIRAVYPILCIDKHKSKMGDDSDICVLTFTVKGKPAAEDLASFVEKGYEWALDADVSSAELIDGEFLVFVEIERTRELPTQIFEMMTDIMHLTDQAVEDWDVEYTKTEHSGPLTVKSLTKLIPLSAGRYSRLTSHALESIRTHAGLPNYTVAPKNDRLDALRLAAGLHIRTK